MSLNWKIVSGNKSIVEINGDETARQLWDWVKDQVVLPFIDLDVVKFDLSVEDRDETNDQVTIDAVNAIKKFHVGVKCPTINPDEKKAKEYELKKMVKSPDIIIREMLGGTLRSEPIICKKIPQPVPGWTKPIIMMRHVQGDQYKSTDFVVPGAGKVEIKFTPSDPSEKPIEHVVHNFDGPGVAMAMCNTDESITKFAHNCFKCALEKNYPLYLGTNNTMSKYYDGRFKAIFKQVYKKEYREKFRAAGIEYEHRLIDDMVAFALKSSGGFVWACKNYDGDVQTDMVAQGYSSLGMMYSVLQCEDGKTMLAEPVHGTVTRHWDLFQVGERIFTNPVGMVYAWTQAFRGRAAIDNHPRLVRYCDLLEETCLEQIERGMMTKDLAIRVKGGIENVKEDVDCFNAYEYLCNVNRSLYEKLKAEGY